ncbi:hypothetical protein NQK81_27845 [Amycolatopsis roodepoortensis]|uniref:hypothetical protein n=1 Tax=Amycolatopsis roodepoortensis TaxID=700274 RepID=UPI00214CB0F0|nr:hypothetical protein [Amycolatopsis roodepoortensis]UUV28590.1 hypothetical protein NQK81_27845 [Amycolatopsis roodepoortensis]
MSTPPMNSSGTSSLEPSCPDCHAEIGQVHLEWCDVARCLATGLQRLGHDETCQCPQDTWSGLWPGDAECIEFGWLYGPGLPDLNRLMTTATWDPVAHRWTRPQHQNTPVEGEPR